MKERELFLDKIQIDDTYSMQVDIDSKEFVNIYENDVAIDQFALNRKIRTFFKELQKNINSEDYILDDKNNRLYGKEIHIKEDIYMQVTNKHKELVIEFYHKDEENNIKILYLTRMNYMTQKLFYMMLIPKKVKDDPKYQILNPKEFKDLMDILSMIKI